MPASQTALCARVIHTDGETILVDGSGQDLLRLRLQGGAIEPPRAGDFCEFLVEEPGVARSFALLARPRAGEFPSPGGEWYRLHLRPGPGHGPGQGRARVERLRQRGALLARIRRFFAARDFLEIEAPLLVPSPGLELHLQAYELVGGGYLITSPEYQLKRLLSGGLRRVYSLGKVFRRGEAGPHHNPEFTMLEWYRAYEGWEAVADDVEALCAEVAEAACGAPRIRLGEQEVDLAPPWPRMTVAEAVERHAGVRLRGDEEPALLRQKVAAAGVQPPSSDAWDDLFFSLFLDRVEPRLGQGGRPVVLHDWPRPLCALAREKPGAPQVVERFEAYAAGLELCNGFGELCDPAEQRLRLLADQEARRRRGLPVYPIDERFLAALEEGMPPAGGVALGVDRLMMLALGAETIREVLPFAADEL